ncbi:MAG: hypothetical protein QG673_1983 [Pseudomonadota bacterium]|nr:hypothetical protein [Pseudomonadota bacterium]
MRNKLFILWICCLSLLLVSCSGGGTSASNGSSVYSLGQLPNGSTVWISQSTFTAESGGYTTGTIGIIGGTPNNSYIISFGSNPSGPSISSNPNPCVLVSGSGNTCQVTFNSSNAGAGTYIVTAYYTAIVNSNQQAMHMHASNSNLVLSESSGGGTALANTITFIVSGVAPVIESGVLVIAAPAESTILAGESTFTTVMLSGSQNITTPITVTIASSDSSIITVDPSSCDLTTESNNCTIAIMGVAAGSASINASSAGYATVSEGVMVESVPPANYYFTWMNGTESTWQLGVYGSLGVGSPTNTPGSRVGAANWTDESGNLWLFGGLYNSAPVIYFNDLWKYNISTNQWVWVGGESTQTIQTASARGNNGVYGTLGVASVSNIPGSRQQAVSWVDESGNLWLFGGFGFGAASSVITSPGNLNDLWMYNISTNLWTWVDGESVINQSGIYGTKGVESSTNMPGARNSASGWIDENGNLWLFGGQGRTSTATASGSLNDLWKYNIRTRMWTWVNGSNLGNESGIYGTLGVPESTNVPGARYGAMAWVDESGHLWLFAGRGYSESSGQGYLNDLWKYDINANAWTWINGYTGINNAGIYGTQGVESSTNLPGSRQYSGYAVNTAGNFVLFGGNGYAESGAAVGVTAGTMNDLWIYSVTNNQWTWESGSTSTNQYGIYGTKGIPNSTNIPGSRVALSSWFSGGSLWLFGGGGYAESGERGNLNDLWRYAP